MRLAELKNFIIEFKEFWMSVNELQKHGLEIIYQEFLFLVKRK